MTRNANNFIHYNLLNCTKDYIKQIISAFISHNYPVVFNRGKTFLHLGFFHISFLLHIIEAFYFLCTLLLFAVFTIWLLYTMQWLPTKNFVNKLANIENNNKQSSR